MDKKVMANAFKRLVQIDGNLLELVPDEFKSDLLPDKDKTKAMCIEAVKGNSDNFEYVPENMIGKEKYEALVEERIKYVNLSNTQDVLKDIPKKYITPEIYAKGIWGGYNIDAKAEMDVMLKMYKFDKLHHFVPSVNVLKKYPSNQIEKFDKKIWWHLTKNELYNSNNAAKDALVEALLSFGAFEKDANQEERVGIIEHFATYLPKRRFKICLDYYLDSEKEIINNNFDIKNYNKYVVNKERMLEERNKKIKILEKDQQDKDRIIKDLEKRIKELEAELNKSNKVYDENNKLNDQIKNLNIEITRVTKIIEESMKNILSNVNDMQDLDDKSAKIKDISE